ncbi:MAG: SGNH/GDSL hydrolase family protein [Phycisphaerales bacterium]|nr:MAG: SGNH/GDSL hydrolase family protein [Phycisphaerales bacterium]
MRKIVVRIGLVALASLLTVCLFELVLRCFFPVHLTGGVIGLYRYDEELGVRLQPGIRFLRTTDYQQEMHTNRLGTVNFQESFDGYEQLVFALGDSYTQGTGLPADASYPFQLDLMLNMQDGTYHKKYGVANLGLASFGGEQTLLCLRRYADILGKPDLILFLGCENDHVDDVLFKDGYRHRHLVQGNPRWGLWVKPLQWFSNGTEIGKRLKLLVGRIRISRRIAGPPEQETTSEMPCVAQLQESCLQRLVSASQELGAELVVGWASLPEDSSHSYQWLKEWARTNDVAFADWHRPLQSVRRAIPELTVTNPHSGAHHRTWVNTVIARAFAEQIRAYEALGLGDTVKSGVEGKSRVAKFSAN